MKRGKPLKRKTPLARSWFNSRGTPWRRSPAYKDAVMEAFAPYTNEDGMIRCVLCGKYFTPKDISPSHIKGVGAWAHLRCEPKNIMPNCWACHGKYEGWTEKYQMKKIEEILPGREAELLELARRKSEIGGNE